MSQRKKYSKEFKIDAINLVQEQGYSCSEAAKSLDIPYDLLNRWIRESKKSDKNEAFRGNGPICQLLIWTRPIYQTASIFCAIIKCT